MPLSVRERRRLYLVASDSIGSGGAVIRVRIKSSSEDKVLVNLLPWSAASPPRTSVSTSVKWADHACHNQSWVPSGFPSFSTVRYCLSGQDPAHHRCSGDPEPAGRMKYTE